MASNVAAVAARAPASTYRERFDQIGQLVTGESNATAHDAVAWIQTLCAALNVPPLSEFGISPDDFDVVIAKSKQASSMKGNPVTLSDQELRQILTVAL
jgi:alcohol dehydrogenase class IV